MAALCQRSEEGAGVHRGVLAVALGFLALQAMTNALGGYGYFRDELYYLACSDHLAWGYVDQPPLSILVLKVWRTVFGDSLFALRLLPALAGTAVVLLTGRLSRQMGGGAFAQVVASLAAALAPQYLGVCGFYSMNSFDLVFWALLLLVFAKIAAGGEPRLWLAFGAIAGLGAQNKYSVLFLCLGLLVGLLFTPTRRALLSKWPWIGAVIALAIFLPHLYWQAQNGWPTLEFMRNATLHKNAQLSPLGFLGGQVLLMQPANVLLWVPGLLALLFSRDLRTFRALGIAFLAILVVFIEQHGKPYYLSPAYPALFAAGGVVLARICAAHSWLKALLAAPIVLVGLLLVPFALPLLPVESFVRYSGSLGVRAGGEERDRPGRLDQHYADMFGWEELAHDVAAVQQGLPPEDRARCAIYAQNYGEAAAIDFFGPPLGLPRALSGHNSYWTWGPGSATGEVLIIVGGRIEEHRQHFRECVEAGRHRSEYARSFEGDLGIFVCRESVQPLAQLWPSLRDFI
jgi:hypothetical protein